MLNRAETHTRAAGISYNRRLRLILLAANFLCDFGLIIPTVISCVSTITLCPIDYPAFLALTAKISWGNKSLWCARLVFMESTLIYFGIRVHRYYRDFPVGTSQMVSRAAFRVCDVK